MSDETNIPIHFPFGPYHILAFSKKPRNIISSEIGAAKIILIHNKTNGKPFIFLKITSHSSSFPKKPPIIDKLIAVNNSKNTICHVVTPTGIRPDFFW
ncbi:hypothetical protein [Providencia stuartii]|uniref:hypothetical protein n=1 Tax=Providencia stuartii TaxID=588 RepID=UPI003003967E